MKLTNKQKITIAISTVLLLGTTAYIIVNRKKKKKAMDDINKILDGAIKDPANLNQGQVIISNTQLATLPDGKFPIKIGDRSKKVYAIQQALNRTYGTSIDLDGKYGNSTWETLCDKLWNVGITHTKYTSCYEANEAPITSNNPLGQIRRRIVQKDYEAIVNHQNFDGDSSNVCGSCRY